MCGIVAYIGRKVAQPLLIEGLKRLEYRGYDSAGIAVVLFVVLKLIGLIVKFALIAAVLGFIAGLILARSLRPRSP